MDFLAVHKQRQRDQSTWTIKTNKKLRTADSSADDSQRCRCCDVDHALKTIDILRSKMVSISYAQQPRRVYKCGQITWFVVVLYICVQIYSPFRSSICCLDTQVNKNARIEAEVQRRLELDQRLQYATPFWDKYS